jgi:hypothetical protein
MSKIFEPRLNHVCVEKIKNPIIINNKMTEYNCSECNYFLGSKTCPQT